MRNKLALMVALAGFGIVTALGVGGAGATDPLSEGVTAAAVPAATACVNGLDDDRDGLIDLADPDCTDVADLEEEPLAAPTEDAAPAPAPAVPSAPEAPGPSDEGSTQGRGVEEGAAIDGSAVGGGDSPHRNDSLGDTSGGEGGDGSITAPSANGGGDQPVPENGDGGAHFNDGGSPTTANPTVTFAPFGAAPIGVPNFVIDSFEIPPFLLPIYQACGTEYGIPWEILASINKIETAFGTNLNISSAGAMGWMQFMPESWEAYGLDANGDGRKDPYNPVDAICAAASYLDAAGGTENLYDAIFAYNHADWYVQEVLLYARAYGRLPTDLVSSLTGLTEGAHFPIAA
ncbi:MAG TPA: lytic transglycosylase domain-containing protein, partial [Solirubrobacterales bacterium]|nr:lytic transglycosylase domain-containing protein [Solirubrobacterales bacterium]